MSSKCETLVTYSRESKVQLTEKLLCISVLTYLGVAEGLTQMHVFILPKSELTQTQTGGYCLKLL
jgi:hypothetical protein